MEKPYHAGLKRFAFQYLPIYLVLVLLSGGVVYAATGFEVGWKLALTALLCVPLAGVVTFDALVKVFKWSVCVYLPCYIGTFIFFTGITSLATQMWVPLNMLPVIGILCVPVAGLLAASLSIEHRGSHM